MNPVELGQGTFPLSEAATDRFAAMVNIGYLPAEEEEKLVAFDFKRVRLQPLMSKQRIIELRGAINEHVFLHERIGKYIQRLVAATRPYNPDTDWLQHSPSALVERGVDLGASRARSSCGAGSRRCGRCCSGSEPRCIRKTSRSSRRLSSAHRIWLGPHAASHGLTPTR